MKANHLAKKKAPQIAEPFEWTIFRIPAHIQITVPLILLRLF